MSSKLVRGSSSVQRRIKDAQNRITLLVEEKQLRDSNEIWEAYCDVEEAILISKIIFSQFEKPGKLRKLDITAGFNLSISSENEIRARLQSIGKNLSLAESELAVNSGEVTIEFLRRARDGLKIMLLSPTKTFKKRSGARRPRRAVK